MLRITNRISCLVIVIMLQALLSGEALTQELDSLISPYAGTLDLLLANRNGFVVAADSRRTNLVSKAYYDDSQKLFRTGPKSAMVIAGFASWIAAGSPLDVQVASVLREKFLDEEWTSGKRTLSDLPGLVNTSIGYQLALFGAISATNKRNPAANDFQFIAAEITSAGNVEIMQSGFRPKVELFGPFNLPIASYEIDSTTTRVDRFVAKFAGLDRVAQAILNGTFLTQDSRVLDYYRARVEGKLDDLPLSALEQLAVAILESTSRSTPYVGGPNQIGVFSISGDVSWKLPPLATDRQKLQSTILKIGFTYTSDGSLTPQEHSETRGKNIFFTMSLSLYQPFEQPIMQVFIGNRFRGVAVSLDGNAFVGNEFKQTRFVYRGERFYFQNNALDDCVVETLPEVVVPRQLKSCTRVEHALIESPEILGSPIRPVPTGCVKPNAEGELILKTDGWQNGKSCSDSGFRVPKIIP